MRPVYASALLLAVAVSACTNDRQPMDGRSGRTNDLFLGPIAADFQNTLSPEQFRQAATGEATRIDSTLQVMGFGLAGVPRRGASGTDPTFPDLDHCDNLRNFTGGFLVPGEIASAGGNPDLVALVGLTCQQVAATLDASFSNLTVATGASVRSMGTFSLVQDSCTTPAETPPTTARAAVGYEFIRRAEGDGLYFTGYDLADFTSTLEGGGDGKTLALRSETMVKSNGDAAGTRTLRQELTVASVIRPETNEVESHKSELLKISRTNDGKAREELLGRISVVKIAYGDAPSLQEDTKFTRIKEDGTSETWQFAATASPASDGRLKLAVKMTVKGEERAVDLNCGVSAP